MAVNTTDRGTPQTGSPGDLDRVVTWARRLAAQREEPVGPRELLLGLAAAEPRLVVNVASQHGVDPRRLAWALSEWWSGEQVPALGREPALTAPARAALARAAASGEMPVRRALAAHLLGSAAGAPATAPVPAPNDAPPDVTHAVLRRLELI